MGEGIKVSFAMALLTYLIVGTIQICIIGYHILVSQRCSEAFWNCEWCDMPLDCIKDITFCIMRSQKTLGLTAGAFVTLSNSTLTDVTKAAMGYLSILRNFLTE
ncbi:hypothetical protein KQX54_016822 [Cotesia glomerata]|uniref:Olfactory receptor n=1 Tax=Cotesia glomerata TaxID=32391 RepID=A0AAV7HYQ5_COTGL|nr:hypothetical protein KQX54_016822 [Cotesia glomerata]